MGISQDFRNLTSNIAKVIGSNENNRIIPKNKYTGVMTITKKSLKVGKIRNAEYYDMVEVFDKLYADSINNQKFYALMKIIESEDNIKPVSYTHLDVYKRQEQHLLQGKLRFVH